MTGFGSSTSPKYDLSYINLSREPSNPRQPIRHEVITHILGAVLCCSLQRAERHGLLATMVATSPSGPYAERGARSRSRAEPRSAVETKGHRMKAVIIAFG